MSRRRRMTGALVAVSVAVLAAGLQWGGGFDRLEHAVSEFRYRVLEHEVASDIVIVGIDGHSLEALDQWPWPRRFHARLLQQLSAAGPAEVFFDIDFSSESPDPLDDELLENELLRWQGSPVLLAAHEQPSRGTAGASLTRRPLDRFLRHAREVSVAIEPDRDGLVRRLHAGSSVGETVVPAAFAADASIAADAGITIDYGIAPESFDYVSYSDLLNGEIEAADLAGRRVFVGATAAELGDSLPVPRYGKLPGVVVQALGAATLAEGPLHGVPRWAYAIILATVTGLVSFVYARGSWRRNSAVGAAALALVIAASLLLYRNARVDFAVMPLAFVILAAFVAASLRSLDQQTWRAIAYAIGVRRRDALLKSVIETSMDSIICIDRAGIIKTANPAASSLFLSPLRALIGAPIAKFIPEFAASEVLSNGGLACEYRAVDSTGRSIPIEATISRVAVDDTILYTTIVRDISERREQQDKLEFQATHDPLTQLPNRAAVNAYLASLLGREGRERRIAVLLLDLCRFKEVNDTLGHDVGDEVLRIVSRRFGDTLTDRAFIGRIGGDEFVVVIPEVSARIAVEQLTESLVESLRAPIQVRGVAIEVGLSVGISFYPEHAGDAVELLRHADIAMYAAKRRNSAYEFYSRDDDRNSIRRLSMVSDLRSAISGNEIDLMFQPQVDLRDGSLAGAEALLRWNHPVHGSVSPSEFVAIAESTDLIQPLTEWTVVESLRHLVVWRHAGLGCRVAVNLSARSLQDVSFPRHLELMLDRFGVSGGELELEITETAMMLDPQRALEVVRDLLALGVRIAIDDFGTGYSSLGYLRDLHASALKLDKSFVVDLENRAHNRVIVESTAQMAEALGLEVVAEGVESRWVGEYLASVGYRIGQGFWFGKAMPAEQLIAKFAGAGAQAPQESRAASA